MQTKSWITLQKHKRKSQQLRWFHIKSLQRSELKLGIAKVNNDGGLHIRSPLEQKSTTVVFALAFFYDQSWDKRRILVQINKTENFQFTQTQYISNFTLSSTTDLSRHLCLSIMIKPSTPQSFPLVSWSFQYSIPSFTSFPVKRRQWIGNFSKVLIRQSMSDGLKIPYKIKCFHT